MAVLDVGAVRNLGWAAADVDVTADRTRFEPPVRPAGSGTEIDGLLARVGDALRDGVPVALGFECPCFVPVRREIDGLLDRRSGEKGSAFTAGPGANVLVAGLVESAWILERLDGLGASATVDPGEWPDPHPLLVWEAFVSGDGKRGADRRSIPDGWLDAGDGEHVRDAATGVMAFFRKGRPSMENSDVHTDGDPVFNVVAAAALRAGLTTDVGPLKTPAYVVRAE